MLDGLYDTFAVGFLSTDPLELVRGYEDPKDQEIVGFVAAVLSLGRTELIRRAVGEVLHRMGASPFRFVECSTALSTASIGIGMWGF